MLILPLIEIGLTLLPKVTVGVTQFITWLNTLRTAAQQAEIWTAAHEAEWVAGLTTHALRPEEIPDAQLGS